MNPGAWPRLLRTVWHLRASQLLWRCRAVAERRRRLPRVGAPAAAPVDPASLGADFPEVPLFHGAGLAGAELIDELRDGRLTLVQRTLELGRARPDWRLGPVTHDRLWAITLHYHGWAHALAEVVAAGGPRAAEAGQLLRHYLTDWLDRCELRAPGARELAWNSFAIATRLSWWIRTWLTLRRRPPAFWGELAPRLADSMARQAGWLRGHLEWDLRGNHLLRDLVGLAWAGRFLGGPSGTDWVRTATERVTEQLTEQLLPDGGHFERSPMYHVHVMEDLLSLALLLDASDVVEELKSAWLRMAGWLSWLRHPDGAVPLFNDGGLHAVCAPAHMLALGRRLGFELDVDLPRGGKLFPDSGIVVWHGDPWSVFLDVGRIAADHVPGHGHADTLTLECSFDGARLFVDPGSFAYDHDERRRYDRSTASHNTVCIDDVDSSETWHIFRVGRRARPLDVRAVFERDGFEASAAHNGYEKIGGRPQHRRRVATDADGRLVVEDGLGGRGRHRACGGLLLDPAWRAEPADAGWLLTREGRRLRVEVRARGATPRLEQVRAPYHPDYGVEITTARLQWTCEDEFPLEVRTEIGET